MSESSADKKITGKECMHITYSVSKDNKNDALFIKEYTHYNDGSIVPSLRMIENYERSFWVTKPARRDHKDKLQWEERSNCDERRCRQIELYRKADLALGGGGYASHQRQVFSSPYLWGCATKPQCLIKYDYAKTYPDTKSNLASVAYMDTETNELNGSKEIIIGCVSFKERVMISIDRRFFNNTDDELVNSRFFKKLNELIGDVVKERNINVELRLRDNAGEITKDMLDCAHEWAPDFVAIWNISFDIPKMISALKKYGFNLDDCFSDPSVPPHYRFMKWTEGKSIKETHDGKINSINPEQQWHVVECPAKFFFIDGMTLYYRVRMGGGMEDGYSLDAVLERNLNVNKLNIDETRHLTGIDWHKVMQSSHQYEYAIYCIMDCIRGEQLDEYTGDIAVKLPATCKYSDFTDFKSGPRRIADEMHFHCLENGYVVGVIGDSATDENDQFIVESVDWIMTLPAFMGHADLGLDFVEHG